MATFYLEDRSSAGTDEDGGGAAPPAAQNGWVEEHRPSVAKAKATPPRRRSSFGPEDASHRRLLTSALSFNPHTGGGSPSDSLRGALRPPSLEAAAGPQSDGLRARRMSQQLQSIWLDPAPAHAPAHAPAPPPALLENVGARSVVWAMQTIAESAVHSDWLAHHGSSVFSGFGGPRTSDTTGAPSPAPPDKGGSVGKDPAAVVATSPSRIVLTHSASIRIADGRRHKYANPLEEIAAGYRG